ncbi:MAG: DUF1223 domain-containing protein [Ferruginibacter sp.]
MKHIKFYTGTLLLVAFIIVVTTASRQTSTKKFALSSSNSKGFVVMELFTSQGCSSCPPADALLGKYTLLDNDQIIPLAFHVDYWNRLGWKDPFSNSEYSKRQRDYAMLIDNSSVYTPQLIVNGEVEFVGSDAAKISSAVDKAFKILPQLEIKITELIKKENKLITNFIIDKNLPNTTLNAALVQKTVTTNILKGENSGLKLTNYNVVRDFSTLHLVNSSSEISLRLPADYDHSKYMVVLYIQEDASGKIIGAVQNSL